MVSVRADMGVLCLLEDLRSRALALPVPFLDAGAMMACYGDVGSGVASAIGSASDRDNLSSRAARAVQSRSWS